MDLNQPVEFTPSETSFPQIQHFMLPLQQSSNQDAEEVKQANLLVQKHNLELFWHQQIKDIHNISVFKSHHQLPLARIKKVMKSDKDVKLISAETPMLISKACEIFIMELTLRAWMQNDGGNRRTLNHDDIARAIRQEEALHFLANAVPCINHKDEEEEEEQGEQEKEVKLADESERDHVNQLQFPLLDMNAEVGGYEKPRSSIHD